MDCATLVCWLEDDVDIRSSPANLLALCKSLLARQWEVVVQHVYRDGNCSADILAHEAFNYG